MSNKSPDLLDDIIEFLEQEKEMYGPFSVSADTGSMTINSGKLSKSNTEKPIQEEKQSVPETTQTNSNADAKTRHDAEPEPDTPRLSINEKLERCKSLDELKDLCAGSDQLRTDLEGTNLVFGVGNPVADLMIVGEAPGYHEDQEGEPFVGAAGQLLNKILKAIDFDREDVYIANILKHRPPDNRNPTSEERQRSLPFLQRQIDLISPKVILCVGKVSGTTLLGKDEALKQMRGQFYDYRGAKLTVTYHPAALLRNPEWKRPTWEDVQQVRKKYDELGGTP